MVAELRAKPTTKTTTTQLTTNQLPLITNFLLLNSVCIALPQGDDLGRYTVCVKDTKRKQLVLMANTAAKQRGVRWSIPVHAFRLKEQRKVVSPGGFFSKIILVVYSCIAYPVWFLVFLFKACHLLGFCLALSCLICYIYKLGLKFIFLHFPAVYCILSHFYFAMVPVVSMRSDDLPRNRST